MHIDMTISLGNIISLAVLFGVAWRVDNLFRRFAIEHEILVRDYCERHGLELSDLPTRSR